MENTYEFNLVDDGTDQTKVIREHIASVPDGTPEAPNKIVFIGRAKTTGMTPEDLTKEYPPYGFIGDAGAGKILPIHNRKNLHISGGKFYNDQEVFTEETRPVRRHHTVSENTFIDLKECQNISITDLEFTGPHNTIRETTGFPEFYGSKEFEHFLDIKECQNIYLRGLNVSHIYGDFVYFRRSYNSHITIKDCTVYFNGRQGIAWGDANNVLIDNLRVELSGRGGADFEPPTEDNKAINVIIRNSHFKTWLLPFPMGGRGVVANVLIENNTTETSSFHTNILGDRVSSIRKNIIFRGNKALGGFGSPKANYPIVGGENILIENEYTPVAANRSQQAIYLGNSRNVTVRNNDFGDAKYITISDTPIEEAKIYGNVQDLQYIVHSYSAEFPWIDPPYVFAEEYKRKDGGVDFTLWKTAFNEWSEYMNQRSATISTKYVDIQEYDVAANGEPNVPKEPDFIPYMGVDTVETEPPVEPEPTPDPEKPQEPETPEPIEEPKPPVEQPEESKKWHENKLLWVVGGVVLVIILALVI